jgi:hypothetical protein
MELLTYICERHIFLLLRELQKCLNLLGSRQGDQIGLNIPLLSIVQFGQSKKVDFLEHFFDGKVLTNNGSG